MDAGIVARRLAARGTGDRVDLRRNSTLGPRAVEAVREAVHSSQGFRPCE
jgi:hypothetical protein